MANINFYNTECIEFMKTITDKHYDLAIVDIEYCIGASKPSIKPSLVKQKNGNILNVKQPNYTPKDWDFKKSSQEYFDQLFRVSQKQIIWGGNYYGLEGGYLVWDKINGESDQFGAEMAWLSFSPRTDIVHYMWSGMFQGKYCGFDIKKALVQQGDKSKNEVRRHPTQKPVILYRWMLNEYAKQGYKILDTHGGSFTHAIACDIEGFDLDICEQDEEYYESGVKAFKLHKSQTRLF